MTLSCRVKRIGFLVCLGGFVFGAQASAAAARVGSVKLWSGAVVIEDVVRLDDVAELSGFDAETEASLKELVVASAPTPGGSRIIPLTAIRETLVNAGVNRATTIVKGSAECAVRRPVQAARPAPEEEPPTLPATNEQTNPAAVHTLREAVTDYFDLQLAAYDARSDISFGRTSAQVLDLRGPEFTFCVRRKSGSALGLSNIEVTVFRGELEVQRVPMVVNVAMVRDVVVAHRGINRSATVRSEDVRLVPRRFTRTGRIGISGPGAVIGLRAKRFIPAGELLDARDLERVPLVKRGQIVEVVSRIGTVSVKTTAKVNEDGDYGELVTLHMPGRRKAQIVGCVIGPRSVLVGNVDSPDRPEIALADGGMR